MNAKAYWEQIYATKASNEVSWGDSRLVDRLVERGLHCVFVLDVSGRALARAKARRYYNFASTPDGLCRHTGGRESMSQPLGFDVELSVPFEAAVREVKDVLKQEGFGMPTEIDLRAAFREKLGREFRPYIILGAYNPPLAFTAVTADPEIGLLLP